MARYKNKSEQTKVNEPMIGYGVSLLGMLYGLNVNSIPQTKIAGQSLVELQAQTSLTAQEMSLIVGVSKSKYYELLQKPDIGAKHVDALVDFAVLWNKGLAAFDNDQALLHEWLHTRNTNLGGLKPIALLGTRVGRRELEKAFNRITYSTYG